MPIRRTLDRSESGESARRCRRDRTASTRAMPAPIFVLRVAKRSPPFTTDRPESTPKGASATAQDRHATKALIKLLAETFERALQSPPDRAGGHAHLPGNIRQSSAPRSSVGGPSSAAVGMTSRFPRWVDFQPLIGGLRRRRDLPGRPAEASSTRTRLQSTRTPMRTTFLQDLSQPSGSRRSRCRGRPADQKQVSCAASWAVAPS